MQREQRLINDNIELLKQGLDLIDSVTDEAYSQGIERISHSGVGGHFRHCLDFYQSFLTGMDAGRIDYDKRVRDESVEKNRAAACARIEKTIKVLQSLSMSCFPARILVNLEGDTESDGNLGWSWSSARRELQSLLSHTIHHYALIAMILRLQGYEISSDFGVAPSTLQQWRKSS